MTAAPSASQTFSIAMATYNGAKYLRAQLESFAAQTMLPDELVVCDDGSSDESVEIIRRFGAQARFRVSVEVNAERLGYNRNFAKAIGRCGGALIFVSDQDDVWYPEKIEVISRAMAARPDMLIATNDQQVVGNDGATTPGRTVLGNFRRLGYPDIWFGPGCCTAIRREGLDLLSPFPGDVVPYDQWVTLLPAILDARLLIEEVLQDYRRHGDNTSGSVFALRRPGVGNLLRAARESDPRPALSAKVAELDAVLERLNDRVDVLLKLDLAQRLPAAQRRLMGERNAYAARVGVLGLSRIRRLTAVVGLLLQGRYAHFRGMTTAVKDVLS